jgi:phenylalanyl-tRNA synthetase alpha chain
MNIEEIKNKLSDELSAADRSEMIEAAKVAFLGKKGHITSALAGLKSVSGEERKTLGQTINALKREAEMLFEEKLAQLRELEEKALIETAPVYDLSLPVGEKSGSLHPITLVSRECEAIFASMGFTVEEYSEITDDYNCFEALNIPKDHPARDMQDTYYLENGQLLKTHTSAAQNTIMRKYGANLEKGMPIRAIFPGRCFRNEATDACHENTFFQMEGVMVDRDISISNLIYFMKTMLSEVFERDVKVRLRPGFFPFVEPGFELDISCAICGGEGCPSCKNSGWLELCPCGMIHPNVLTAGGIDPEKYTGFAFGLGLTRLAMMKYGIKDIRDFNSGKLSNLTQFVH